MTPPDSILEARFARVVAILRRLRAPDGCPWDRKQTFDSIRPHTLEEAYEVLEAIGDRNWPALREELGDLLLQVLFYADIAREEALFTLEDVLGELGDKLVRRHPHVFKESSAGMSAEDALGRWNAMKREEKLGGTGDLPASLMDGIPRELPALAEAVKLGQRAAGVHFDWSEPDQVLKKVDEELAELRAAAPVREEEEAELGDLLFSLAQWARHRGLEPESALKGANRKFQRRFRHMETGRGGEELAALRPEQWEALWQQAKQKQD